MVRVSVKVYPDGVGLAVVPAIHAGVEEIFGQILLYQA